MFEIESIYIHVTVRSGEKIQDVCNDMCEAAKRIRVPLQAKFNDVLLMVSPGDTAASLLAAYYRSIESGELCKIARGH